MTFEDKLFKRYLELLQELIRNACVNTGKPESGQEIRSVQTLERFFEEFGLKGEAFTSKPGRASLLLKIPGHSGDEKRAPSLMFMGHLDVVPAHSEGWKHPPFGAEISEGRLWGRGTLDMLGQTAAMAAGFADVKARGLSLPGDLLFLAVADEENAGDHGARFLVEDHWDKVKADYMITELGGFSLDLPGPPRAVLTVGEKGVTQLRFAALGRASHGSLPYGVENAGVKLARLMTAMDQNPPELSGSDFFRKMVGQLELPGEMEALLLDPLTVDRGLLMLSRTSPGTARLLHACSRMTVSPNVIKAGEKVNIIADRGTMEADIRTLPGQSRRTWEEYISRLTAGTREEYTMEVMESVDSTISPPDTPLMAACMETTALKDPEVKLVPLLTSVATDGRFWRNRGTVVYGYTFLGRDMTMDRVFSMIHGLNESIPLDSLERELFFFKHLPEVFYKKFL